MFAYSPRKNRPNVIALYSTKKPATISLSPSGRSNGERFVSARIEMKNTMNIGKSGSQYQPRMPNRVFCASTMALRLSEPAHSRTVTRTKPIETS